jgi:hypothetical protein
MILRIDCYLMILLGTKEWIMEDLLDIKRVLENQGDAHTKLDIQSNSELRSLTSSTTQSSGPRCLQIDVQDAYDLQFG